DDQDAALFNSIDNAERESPQKIATRAVFMCWPSVREADDCRFGSVYLLAEGYRSCRAALGVPARGSFGFFESFVEVFKLASHGRLPRGCGDALPTMESSWRCRRRFDRGALESRQTTPLPRPRPPRSRDFES